MVGILDKAGETGTYVSLQAFFSATPVKKRWRLVKQIWHKEYNLNLFSITTGLQSLLVLSGYGENIMLTKGNEEIKFVIVISTFNGAIHACYFQ